MAIPVHVHSNLAMAWFSCEQKCQHYQICVISEKLVQFPNILALDRRFTKTKFPHYTVNTHNN